MLRSHHFIYFSYIIDLGLFRFTNAIMATDSNRLRALEGFVLGDSWAITSRIDDDTDNQNNVDPALTDININDPDPEENQYRGHEHEHEHGLAERGDSNTLSAENNDSERNSAMSSGPELIMPSICHEDKSSSLLNMESSSSSWILPSTRMRNLDGRLGPGKSHSSTTNVKSETKNQMQGMDRKRRRRKRMTNADAADIADGDHDYDYDYEDEDEDEDEQDGDEGSKRGYFRSILETTIRQTINVLLIAAMIHILVMPELIYQKKGLCEIQAISSFYASSCSSISNLQSSPSSPPPSSSSSWQTQTQIQETLQKLFETTLQQQTTSPYIINALKHSESALRAIYPNLRQLYPGAKNALYLEFDGCWHALRSVTHELDSLQVDLRSAVDSLIAAGSLQRKQQQQQLLNRNGDDAAASSKQRRKKRSYSDSRISAQMLQREEYLERLGWSIQSRADSLGAGLTMLEDHLSSIEAIVIGEEQAGSRSPNINIWTLTGPTGNALRRAFWDSVHIFLSSTGLTASGVGGDSCNARVNANGNGNGRQNALCLLREAAKYHRPVIFLARNLSTKLRNLQRSRTSLYFYFGMD